MDESSQHVLAEGKDASYFLDLSYSIVFVFYKFWIL